MTEFDRTVEEPSSLIANENLYTDPDQKKAKRMSLSVEDGAQETQGRKKSSNQTDLLFGSQTSRSLSEEQERLVDPDTSSVFGTKKVSMHGQDQIPRPSLTTLLAEESGDITPKTAKEFFEALPVSYVSVEDFENWMPPEKQPPEYKDQPKNIKEGLLAVLDALKDEKNGKCMQWLQCREAELLQSLREKEAAFPTQNAHLFGALKEADPKYRREMRQFFEARLVEGNQIARDEWRLQRMSLETEYLKQLQDANERLEDRINQVKAMKSEREKKTREKHAKADSVREKMEILRQKKELLENLKSTLAKKKLDANLKKEEHHKKRMHIMQLKKEKLKLLRNQLQQGREYNQDTIHQMQMLEIEDGIRPFLLKNVIAATNGGKNFVLRVGSYFQIRLFNYPEIHATTFSNEDAVALLEHNKSESLCPDIVNAALALADVVKGEGAKEFYRGTQTRAQFALQKKINELKGIEWFLSEINDFDPSEDTYLGWELDGKGIACQFGQPEWYFILILKVNPLSYPFAHSLDFSLRLMYKDAKLHFDTENAIETLKSVEGEGKLATKMLESFLSFVRRI